MQKKLENIKFNLTESMSKELLVFNKLKKELNDTLNLYNLDKNDNLLDKIEQIKLKIDLTRKKFIDEFQKNNKKEILEYKRIIKKDQK